MKIGIIGSPGYKDQINLNSILDYLLKETDVESIYSDSSEIGTLADTYSYSRGILTEIVETSEIIQESEWVIAFWDGIPGVVQNQLTLASKIGRQITINRIVVPLVKVENVNLEEFF